ncbi:type II toxin-antitoxin system VapC family toxin [Crocosphaera sp.]|uniref:type II toxin-antitoxin system VapC family toxin n=1 Tax=Crocosphaera sp. TaxID=2729996 RepID=UPI003F1E641C|nr:type II toxin-antitoxin system VapC family toxin [Crocosphaera sp.]
MSGKYLLDTNIIIALFANDSKIKNRLIQAGEVFIPSIVIGELYYGANKSQRVQENLTKIEDFVANNVILSCDETTSRYYGEVKNSLRLKGRPLPENDLWISAITIQYNLLLVTRDAHFNEVEQINCVKW